MLTIGEGREPQPRALPRPQPHAKAPHARPKRGPGVHGDPEHHLGLHVGAPTPASTWVPPPQGPGGPIPWLHQEASLSPAVTGWGPGLGTPAHSPAWVAGGQTDGRVEGSQHTPPQRVPQVSGPWGSRGGLYPWNSSSCVVLLVSDGWMQRPQGWEAGHLAARQCASPCGWEGLHEQV